MYVIIAYNDHFDLMAFGPYDTEDDALEDERKLELKHPGARYLVLAVDSDYCSSLPNEHTPGYYRPVSGGMYEKNSETGEVRERPLYTSIHDFPG